MADVIEGIADYYFNLYSNFKKIMIDFDQDLNFQKIKLLRKKWLGEMKFSGIMFSKIIKEKLTDIT